jgi:hypothetical protein
MRLPCLTGRRFFCFHIHLIPVKYNTAHPEPRFFGETILIRRGLNMTKARLFLIITVLTGLFFPVFSFSAEAEKTGQ